VGVPRLRTVGGREGASGPSVAVAVASRALSLGNALAALSAVGPAGDAHARPVRGIALAQWGERRAARRELLAAHQDFVKTNEPLYAARCAAALAEIAAGDGRSLTPNQCWKMPPATCEGALWVGAKRSLKVDPADGRLLKRVTVERLVTGVTWAEGELWHGAGADEWAGGVLRVDPNSGAETLRLECPTPTDIAGIEYEATRGVFWCGASEPAGRPTLVAKLQLCTRSARCERAWNPERRPAEGSPSDRPSRR